MKESMKRTVMFAIGMALALSLTSCASVGGQSGFMDGYYAKLQPGPEGGAKERWLKPGVDFSKYNRVMLDSVVFYFAPDSEDKGIDPEQMKELSDSFNKALVDALKDKYPVVSEPGPDVARIKIALTGIKASRPVLSGITSIVPIGLGISIIKKGTTGSWSGSGATAMEMLAIDTQSNEVIAAVKDVQTAGFTERFSKYGSAEDAFQFWAKRLRAVMDEQHGIKPQQ